jgi:chemosensory pili system protein ChpA (sensor histidine kinase/response regulator)
LREAVDSLGDDERCSVAEGLPPQPIPQENSIAVPMESLQKTASLAAGLHSGISALADIVAALDEEQEVAGLTTALELLREQMHGVKQLEEEIAGARRVSFARLVPRLQRLSARHSSLLDKQVRLLIQDVDLCAERSLVERLVAPLEHLLRNAIDHGIETPAQRRSCGKAETGTVEIHIQEAAGALCVSMHDDGAGIDARMLPQGLESLFLPGLSTKPQANEDAGHGLGLAAVKATILALGGSVELSSAVGQGSCFTLRLPV